MRSSRPFAEDDPQPEDRLLVVLDKPTILSAGHCLLEVASQALAGGARRFWYRNHLDQPTLQHQDARALVRLFRTAGAQLLVGRTNDLSPVPSAAGLHLAASGVPIPQARQRWPADWVGRSCHSLAEMVQAQQQGADYVTLSPIFPPHSAKVQPRPALGWKTLELAVQAVEIPILALGGIDRSNIATCLRCGAFGAAVLGAVCLDRHPLDAVRELIAAITSALAPTTDREVPSSGLPLPAGIDKESAPQ
ncbi:MAG: thiamine phosphate synthase [Bradymonadales bacterium]|nr:thiamine phosphate synthase [Bradymonadales bacterium]